MAEHDSLAALQGLHRDLCAHMDLQLPVLERLLLNLEAHLEELKTLLDKKPKNDASRQALSSGNIKIDDNEYEVNDDFKQQTLQLADALNLDELDAAALFLGAQSEAQELDRSQLQTAVIRFHRRREYLVLCVRILIKTALDNGDLEVEGLPVLHEAAQMIVGVHGTTNLTNAYGFWTKCLTSMESVEKWLQFIAERIQSTQVVGQVPLPGFVEIMDFQRQSLTRQHENLAAICTHLVKPGYVNLDNYKALLSRAKSLDRHDLITIHYVPVILRLTSWVASESNNVMLTEARALHDSLMAGRESDNWALRTLHSATLTWWLAEYSGRYMDPNTQDAALQGINFDDEANARSEIFLKALNDGAFHFMLSVSQDVRPTRWYDPHKTSMLSTLLQDTAVLSRDSPQPDEFFKMLLMEKLQTFVDSFITHMPDTLRRLKADEDDQRRRLQLHFQRSTGEYPLHLERFMVIVAYAFDGFPDAAEDFWNDKESNLYGFLQWTAKRQPTPRIAMFCEMLRAIGSGEANAEAAHRFLLEEGASASGKIRRTSSLSYTTIFNELREFENDIHEPKKTIQSGVFAPTNPIDQIVEPESATMLESYLRLIAHICRQSPSARMWILDLKEYHFADICFGLCTDRVESGLRAAAYDALSALLVGKDVVRADAMWGLLDEWTVNGFYTGTRQNNAPSATPRDDLWPTLADGYDESVALVRFLHSLVEPYPENEGLNDSLPFPEALGSSRRMPGIESYIDFVMQQVFAERSLDVIDPLQRNVMRWTCLRFMVTCLSTFNENLVVFANKSSIPVDEVIDPTSLAVYVALHPFARVMEWLFNDKVLRALFAASHHDVTEVDAAPSDSPLVQSLMLSIEVMDLVMKLQATYLDIVKPVLKQQTSFHHSPVSNLSLVSFEDAILNNLQIIVDLGLYCGTGHETLTIASLQLLEKMASSRKLAVSPAGFGQRSGRSKIVGILEKDNEAERIGRSLSGLMRFSAEELEAGEEASGYIVKLRVLDFLNSCLAAVSLRPTIAHVLLGFSCGTNTVRIAEDSLWSNGQALFHSILLLGVQYPDHDGEQFIAWRSALKTRCWDVLQKLWRSPLTSAVVMEELRDNELLFIEAPQLTPITLDIPWEGMSLAQGLEVAPSDYSAFFSGPSALALQSFLQRRAAFLDYESRELRLTVKESMPTMKSRIQSILLGITIRPGEDATPNPNIFDLFDFIELAYPERALPDQHKFFEGVNLTSCQEEKEGSALYSLPLLEQVIRLKMKYWRKENLIQDQEQEEQLVEQAEMLLAIFLDWNRRTQLLRYHKDILQSWVQVVMVAVHSCDFENGARSFFIMQTLQVILPKFEQSYTADIFTALQLASLAESLIQKIDFESTAFAKTGDFANDRLSQLFRAALVGIYSPVSTAELREYCYQICFRYIHGTSNKATHNSLLGRHTLGAIRKCGTNMLEVICDDAYSGQGTCKVSALLLLNAFVGVATCQSSKYILDSFVSLNFVGVLVDNIKYIPEELRAAAAPQVPMLLSYYDASLALLLRVSQSRLGAAHVLNAGLFPAICDSQIFSVDPDIGLEFDDPNALRKYYELMLAVLRVVNAAVIARGRQNDQTVFQAREFLKENRHSMVSIFKRSVNVGVGMGEELQQDIVDLLDCWTVLVDVTGFLQYEDQSSLEKARPNMFS